MPKRARSASSSLFGRLPLLKAEAESLAKAAEREQDTSTAGRSRCFPVCARRTCWADQPDSSCQNYLKHILDVTPAKSFEEANVRVSVVGSGDPSVIRGVSTQDFRTDDVKAQNQSDW